MAHVLQNITNHWLFRLGVSALLLWIVVWQLADVDWALLTPPIGSGTKLTIALLLVVANLGLEAAKLQQAFAAVHIHCSYATSALAVLGSSTAALITPNRLGEIPARLLWLPVEQRLPGTVAVVAERLVQLAVTLVAGLLSLLYLKDYLPPFITWATMAGAGIVLLGMLAWALWPQAVSHRLGCLPRLGSYIQQLPPLPARRLLPVLGLATLRYGVFAFQYMLLLCAFGVDMPCLHLFSLVAFVYLLKSVVPGIALAELGVREAIAVWVFGLMGVAAAPVLAATLALFVFNLLLPAGIGLVPGLRWLWAK